MQEHITIRINLSRLISYVGVFVAAAILFIGAQYLFAATPNPGHPWTEIGNGTWQVANTQTGLRTFTFPDTDATVLTSANASTSLFSLLDTLYVGRTATTTISSSAINLPTGGAFQINGSSVISGNTLGSSITASSLTSLGTLASLVVSGLSTLTRASSTIFSSYGPSYFGATATSSFDTAGALTLATPLGVGSGGTGLTTLTSNNVILGNGASSVQFVAPSTAGRVLMSNGTTWISTATSTFISVTVPTRPLSGLSTGAITGTTSINANTTLRLVGLFNIPQRITINQVSFSTSAGTTGTAKVCIYNEAGDTKLVDVTSGTLAVGTNNVTVSPAVSLDPDNYYIVIGCASTCTSLNINDFTTTANALLSNNAPSGKTKYEGRVTHGAGACDAALGAITAMPNATPLARIDN